MGEKRSIVRSYVSQGLKLKSALSIMGITKNHYYPGKRKKVGKAGRPISTHTEKYIDEYTKQIVPNERVVDQMEHISEDPDTQYGYKRMTAAMMLLGYMIGTKKVYRLMRENGLLRRRYRPSGKTRVRGRRVDPDRPLQVLSMDIKQVWVEEYARSAYILSIIDTFTRAVLHQSVGYQMKQEQIRSAWEEVITKYLQGADLLSKGLTVEIRNDNGPQFAAKMVMDFLHDNGIDQVFTYPYCPEQNGHIESYHAILSQHLEMFQIQTLDDLQEILDRFYLKYNYVRLHGSIGCLPPALFWTLWEDGRVAKYYTQSGKPKFKITVPYWKLSGNGNLREFPITNQARRA